MSTSKIKYPLSSTPSNKPDKSSMISIKMILYQLISSLTYPHKLNKKQKISPLTPPSPNSVISIVKPTTMNMPSQILSILSLLEFYLKNKKNKQQDKREEMPCLQQLIIFQNSPHLRAIQYNPEQLVNQALLYMTQIFMAAAQESPVIIVLLASGL